MSKYITYILQPYQGNIDKMVGEVLYEDHKLVCDYTDSRGLAFLIAYIGVMFLSILKVIYLIFDNCKKPKRPLPKITRQNVDRATDLSPLYEMKEARNCNNPQYKTKNHANRTQAIIKLRDYLYKHNMTLRGYILKEVNHRVSDHDFISSIISGDEMAKFTTTYITFDGDIDEMLFNILPTKPRKSKVQGMPCLAFENDYGFMTEELRQLYQEPVKVVFDNI